MDSYLNIISLALAIAALVPILFPRTRVKFWTVSIAALSFLLVVSAYQIVVERQRASAVAAAKRDIVRLLKQRPMTFEQLYDSTYYRDFGIANLAMDELVEEGRVIHAKKETTDVSGRTFLIREFALAQPN